VYNIGVGWFRQQQIVRHRRKNSTEIRRCASLSLILKLARRGAAFISRARLM
jgi:hypothetical protein